MLGGGVSFWPQGLRGGRKRTNGDTLFSLIYFFSDESRARPISLIKKQDIAFFLVFENVCNTLFPNLKKNYLFP